MGISVIATGKYVSDMIATNEDFVKIVDTSDEWIYTRTGMKERHVSQGEPTWYMATRAAQNAIDKAGIDVSEIGMIIVSTITPDYLTPSVSCMVQRELGIKTCMAFDVNAACTGSVYAMDIASRFIATDDNLKYVLIVGSENLTKIVDYEDRSTCILFGDGAGACIVGRSDGMYASFNGADGTGARFMVARNYTDNSPFVEGKKKHIEDNLPESKSHYLQMDGTEVYKFAVKAMPRAVKKACEKCGITPDDLDIIIPHQANIRIIEAAMQRLKIPMEKACVNIDKYGNTSSASVALALDEAFQLGRINKGDKVCLVGFGAGLTYGAVIFEA